jgi:hypothetical protein
MSFEGYNNSGILRKNKNKDAPDDRDAQGEATIDGVDYWISGYTRKYKKDGEKYVTLRFKRKDAKAAGPEHSTA